MAHSDLHFMSFYLQKHIFESFVFPLITNGHSIFPSIIDKIAIFYLGYLIQFYFYVFWYFIAVILLHQFLAWLNVYFSHSVFY